jgi:hypothetical protein
MPFRCFTRAKLGKSCKHGTQVSTGRQGIGWRALLANVELPKGLNQAPEQLKV